MKRVLRIIGLVLGSLLGIVLLAAGLLDTLPVEAVSHEVHVTAPEKAATADYGEYIVNTNDCRRRGFH